MKIKMLSEGSLPNLRANSQDCGRCLKPPGTVWIQSYTFQVGKHMSKVSTENTRFPGIYSNSTIETLGKGVKFAQSSH